jgi:glucosamine kinase
MMPLPSPSLSTPQTRLPALGLGIDAGGTASRWALANERGEIVAHGQVAGMTALQVNTDAGRATLQKTLTELVQAARLATANLGVIEQVQAGFTGFDPSNPALTKLLAAILQLPAPQIHITNDIEVAYLDVFQAGEGYLVYAGTGSIAAYIDPSGSFHRAGGRGSIVDDGGSGYWIAREALRHIWRTEDEAPGSWQNSPMAKAVLAHIGSDDWQVSRSFITQSSRGEMGKLALAVASVADYDPLALNILQQAGQELARLANALCGRFGDKPVALAGRVQELHPAIALSMQAHLNSQQPLQLRTNLAHMGAAKMAIKRHQ